MNEVNEALLKMFASNADIGGTAAPADEGETQGARRLSLGASQALGAVDEEMESGSEVRLTGQPNSLITSEAVYNLAFSKRLCVRMWFQGDIRGCRVRECPLQSSKTEYNKTC